MRGAVQQRCRWIGRGGQAEVAGGAERPPQRPGRDVHPLRADQILARRIAVYPLERGVEQLGGEVRHRPRMVADGGARGDRLERRVVLAAPDAFAEPAQQHADLLGLRPVVDVRLVEHDEPPVAAVLSLEQFHVGRAEQQVLEHRVVGEQQVRRVVAHLLTAEQLVRQPWLARVQRLVERRALGGALRGVTGVAAESDLRRVGQQPAQPAELVVGQRVHRIQQQRPNPGSERARRVLGGQRGQHRQQEALRLARPGAGGHHQVPARGRLPQRLLLMDVQRPVQGQCRAAQPGERRIKHPFADQVAQGRPGPVRRGGLEQRPLGQQRAGRDAVGQRGRKRRVTDRQQRPQVTPVGGAQQSAGADRVHAEPLPEKEMPAVTQGATSGAVAPS